MVAQIKYRPYIYPTLAHGRFVRNLQFKTMKTLLPNKHVHTHTHTHTNTTKLCLAHQKQQKAQTI